MLKNIVRPAEEVIVEYYLVFSAVKADTPSYSFPCDEKGNILSEQMNEGLMKSYEWCISHKELFSLGNKIRKHEIHHRPTAYGICSCGETVELINEYMGACECQKCGKWYNMFGNELLPPSMWEE